MESATVAAGVRHHLTRCDLEEIMQRQLENTDPVLIIGGGIAGPALGIAFRRAGIDSVVYESSPSSRDNAGTFLNLAPNGLNALRALDLTERVTDLGFRNDLLVFHTETGRVLAEAPVGGVTIMRGALSRALRDAAVEAGVRFEFGKALAAVAQQAEGVVATFADGTTANGRLLIGADGIHSRTRASIMPDAPKPVYTGIINLGGVVHTDLPATGTAMHMIFGHRSFFGYAVRPSGETYWFSNYAQLQEPARGELESVDAAEYQQRLLALHRDDPPEVTHILQAIGEGIGTYAVYDIPSLPRWHSGSVCLIGDSAHAVGPHVGQGASLALEDAFVLAKCLRDLPDAPAAFAAFERLRRERVERVLKQSRQTGEQKAPTGWLGRKIRDLILPTFLRKGVQATEWMYSYPFNWDERIAPKAA
jgi:2-polyprenyl-6-methoxyphenol hydroxylase-like FAD-dependent oxidoreductase